MNYFVALIAVFFQYQAAFAGSLSDQLFNNSDSLSYAQAREIIDNIASSEETDVVRQKYQDTMSDFMGVDVLTWIEQNPDTFNAINDYVDDPADGSVPLWESTNSKLSSGRQLTNREKDFKIRLEKALAVLPKYSCICFRGGTLSSSRLDSYKNDSVINIGSFYSTSVDPNVAFRFADSGNSGAIEAIFVIKVKSGAPMSSFHQFHWSEFEVLVTAGTSFKVNNVLKESSQRKAIVFLEQL